MERFAKIINRFHCRYLTVFWIRLWRWSMKNEEDGVLLWWCYLYLTHFCPVFPFYTPWKHQIFSGVFREFKMETSSRKKLHLITSKLPTNCLSVFDHFVGLALKGLKPQKSKMQLSGICVLLQSFGLMKFLRLLWFWYLFLCEYNISRFLMPENVPNRTIKG